MSHDITPEHGGGLRPSRFRVRATGAGPIGQAVTPSEDRTATEVLQLAHRSIGTGSALFHETKLARLDAAQGSPRVSAAKRSSARTLFGTTFLIDLQRETRRGRPAAAFRFLEAHGSTPLGDNDLRLGCLPGRAGLSYPAAAAGAAR